MENHQKRAHSAYPFKCNRYSCLNSFATAEQLEEHRLKYHAKIECNQCGKLVQERTMKKHIREMHESDQRIVCDLCGKVLPNKYSYKSHVQTDHEVHARLQCDICKEWYDSEIICFNYFN